MTRIIRIESCQGCHHMKYENRVWRCTNTKSFSDDYHEFRIIHGLATIPEWCPLEKEREP